MKNNINSTKTSNSLFNFIRKYFHKIFYEDESNDYDFTLESSTNPLVSENTYNNNLNLDNETLSSLDTKNDKVYPSIDVNLEYMKVRFNTLINSDIIIREFILSARNKQYRAFLIYIDGMINQDSLNNYILKPLMLKNTANSFEGNQNRVLSEVKTNNITVRKVKKFDIVDYISNCLLPQNNIKKLSEFDELINGINSRKLCFIYRYIRYCI